MRPSIRLAALSRLQVIHVFTHDSVFLGEDGPTHQSVEHVSALRLIPNVDVWRPGDALECAAAWAAALERTDGPTELDPLAPEGRRAAGEARAPKTRARGGYVMLREEGGAPDVVFLATGSEVGVAVEAAQRARQRRHARARRLAAVPRGLRARRIRRSATSVLPAKGAARLDRGRPHRSVEGVGRRRRPHHRHRRLRPLGARRGLAEQSRPHRPAGRRPRARAAHPQGSRLAYVTS